MATTQELINSLKKDKENLNIMLNNMGVETTGNETFSELTPLVGKIVTDPILQDKTIEITENGTINVVADEGYNGLNNVEVVTNVAGSGGDFVIAKKQYALLEAGSFNPGNPPSYLNSVNVNRAHHVKLNIFLKPGVTYKLVGKSGFDYAITELFLSGFNKMNNGETLNSDEDYGNGSGWKSNEFTFIASEQAYACIISVRYSANYDTTVSLTKAAPVYIEEQ